MFHQYVNETFIGTKGVKNEMEDEKRNDSCDSCY